jgi:hypothetical protein
VPDPYPQPRATQRPKPDGSWWRPPPARQSFRRLWCLRRARAEDRHLNIRLVGRIGIPRGSRGRRSGGFRVSRGSVSRLGAARRPGKPARSGGAEGGGAVRRVHVGTCAGARLRRGGGAASRSRSRSWLGGLGGCIPPVLAGRRRFVHGAAVRGGSAARGGRPFTRAASPLRYASRGLAAAWRGSGSARVLLTYPPLILPPGGVAGGGVRATSRRRGGRRFAPLSLLPPPTPPIAARGLPADSAQDHCSPSSSDCSAGASPLRVDQVHGLIDHDALTGLARFAMAFPRGGR